MSKTTPEHANEMLERWRRTGWLLCMKYEINAPTATLHTPWDKEMDRGGKGRTYEGDLIRQKWTELEVSDV